MRMKQVSLTLALLLLQLFQNPAYAADLPYSVLIITGQEESSNFTQRCYQIEQIGSHVPNIYLKEYFKLLAKHPADSTLRESELATLKNNLADKLINLKNFPEKMCSLFLHLHKDPEQGPLWRNYMVQKLSDLYDRSLSRSSKEALIQRLLDLSKDPEPSMSATALLGLERLLPRPSPPVQQNIIADNALHVAKNESFSLQDRTTSIQIAARCGNNDTLALAIHIIKNKNPLMLRISAIATLGIKGNKSHLKHIAPLLNSPDIRIRTAAESAEKKILSRSSKS